MTHSKHAASASACVSWFLFRMTSQGKMILTDLLQDILMWT